MTDVDVIVVGSGCAGSMAAQTLVEAGVRTLMLCPGIVPDARVEPDSTLDFTSLRRSDEHQAAYLLGAKLEGLPLNPSKAGPQLTPPRQHLIREVERLLPLLSSSFFPAESLAYGGLGGGWGLGCCVFSDAELEAAGLPRSALRTSYARIAQRIGISGADDDAAPFTHAGLAVMPPPKLDPTGERISAASTSARRVLRREGFSLGRTALALITTPLGERQPHSGRDLDFYSDEGGAAFRPARAVDALKQHAHFQYEGGWLVTRFSERATGVSVEAQHRGTGAKKTFTARSVMLAAGPLGTARIALRSLGGVASLPLLCSPYAYLACVQPGLLGAHGRTTSFGYSQLSLFHDPDGAHRDVAMGSIYSYRALMLFRLAIQAPVGLADAWVLLRYLMPALTIAGVHLPEERAHAGTLRLGEDPTSPTGDALHVDYPVSETRQHAITQRTAAFGRAMRKLGAWPVRTMTPARGASIHYAGTLPFDAHDAPYTLHAHGRLSGTKNVFVADASGFRFLPAKGPTLSLMAFADSVARAWVERRG